jgi:hypothetical protein
LSDATNRRRKLLLCDRLGCSFDLLVVGGSRMSQRSRRHDPYPWTWEIPLGVVLVILMVLVCGVHLGRGIANVWAGAGWAFRHVLSCSGVCLPFCVVTPRPALMASTDLCHRRPRCGRGPSRQRSCCWPSVCCC